ncbi:MAG: sensor histidine kinase [Ignavibacteriae bacterium]|nr:sensor histidine kinase [Ignavibacteriota bacterium]NOG98052.1 sensor histidine kinase [Ignavibacteriota bacterium]
MSLIKLDLHLTLYVQYEIEKFIDLIFSLENPLIYLILFLLIFSALLILYKTNIITPLRKEYESEKSRLIEKHIKEMALFAELDPNPLLRVDKKGEIISKNSAANLLIDDEELIGKNLSGVFGDNEIEIESIIENDLSISLNKKINNRFYIVIIKGIAEFDAAQIYFNDVTTKEIAETKLREYQKQFANKVEEDRKSFAKELHDGIGQDLSFVRLSIQSLQKYIAEYDSNSFENTIYSIDKMSDNLRSICNELRPRILEEEGLGPAISTLVNDNNKVNSLKGNVSFVGSLIRIPPICEINIFRVVQEAVNNIIKHSNANEFTIQLVNNDDSILIVITDDGIGFETEKKQCSAGNKSFGFTTMKERIESIGGNINFESRKNDGTTIIINLPYKVDNEV